MPFSFKKQRKIKTKTRNRQKMWWKTICFWSYQKAKHWKAPGHNVSMKISLILKKMSAVYVELFE